MSVQQLTVDTFEKEVLDSEVPVLVDFWSPSCAPCRMMEPVIDEVAREKEDTLRVKKVNVWDEPELATRFQISAVPTLLLFKNGEVAGSLLGFHDKQRLLKALQDVA